MLSDVVHACPSCLRACRGGAVSFVLSAVGFSVPGERFDIREFVLRPCYMSAWPRGGGAAPPCRRASRAVSLFTGLMPAHSGVLRA